MLHVPPASPAAYVALAACFLLVRRHRTTHIITSGIAGTMISSGVRGGMISRIALDWVLTLPVTIAVAAGLF